MKRLKDMIFKQVVEKKKNELLEKVHISVDHISDAVFNHLQMRTSGALLITGEWGSGKTYYIKHKIFPLIEEQGNFIPIMVSLYGEVDKNNIAQKVLFAFLDKKGKDVKLATGTIAKNLKNLSDAIPFVKKFVDIDKLITGTGDNIFRFLPHEKLLIFFDDLERMSDKISANDFLGMVNELVENRKCKVVLIANEEEIKGGISYKEKTIEKTIHYTPDISFVFDSLISYHEDEEFKGFLTRNKDFIIYTLTPESNNEADRKDLIKSFSNLRTLKFSLEHYKYIFSVVKSIKQISDELTVKQLKSLWLFTLAVSAEFKKPNNITFLDKKGLDKHASTVAFLNDADKMKGVLGLQQSKNKDEDITKDGKIDDRDFVDKFVEIYYQRLSEQYIYFPEVYSLITSGKAIDKDVFLNDLEEAFNIKQGKVNPAHDLLNRFLYSGYYSFSNEEFVAKLHDLFDYANSGQFDDIVSYLNSGVYLLAFNEYFNKSKDEIVIILKEGVSKLLDRVQINYLMVSQLEMVEGSFNDNNLKGVIEYIKAEIERVEKKRNQLYVERVEVLLFTDLDAFVNEFLASNNPMIRTPDEPIFHNFDHDKIVAAVSQWEPRSIVNLAAMLKYRYLDTSFSSKLIAELNFLHAVEMGVSLLNTDEKILSHEVLRSILMPRIKQCIERLEHFKESSRRD